MVEVVQRVQKIGGSLMVRIPKDIAEYVGIREGDIIKFNPQKDAKDWFGAMPGLAPWDKEDPSVHSKYA
jgi:hypothetical protein